MAPPTHRISIFKRFGNEEWSNDWHVNVGSMTEGAAVADALVEFERRLHFTTVEFGYYRLSTVALADRVFRHVPINLPGFAEWTVNAGLPLYCTLRVDFQTADSDPCRKYFRLPLIESQQEDGKIVAATMTGVQAVIEEYFMLSVAPDNVVSGAGNVVVAGSPHPYVQMRQLHRRKRKVVA